MVIVNKESIKTLGLAYDVKEPSKFVELLLNKEFDSLYCKTIKIKKRPINYLEDRLLYSVEGDLSDCFLFYKKEKSNLDEFKTLNLKGVAIYDLFNNSSKIYINSEMKGSSYLTSCLLNEFFEQGIGVLIIPYKNKDFINKKFKNLIKENNKKRDINFLLITNLNSSRYSSPKKLVLFSPLNSDLINKFIGNLRSYELFEPIPQEKGEKTYQRNIKNKKEIFYSLPLLENFYKDPSLVILQKLFRNYSSDLYKIR